MQQANPSAGANAAQQRVRQAISSGDLRGATAALEDLVRLRPQDPGACAAS